MRLQTKDTPEKRYKQTIVDVFIVYSIICMINALICFYAPYFESNGFFAMITELTIQLFYVTIISIVGFVIIAILIFTARRKEKSDKRYLKFFILGAIPLIIAQFLIIPMMLLIEQTIILKYMIVVAIAIPILLVFAKFDYSKSNSVKKGNIQKLIFFDEI